MTDESLPQQAPLTDASPSLDRAALERVLARAAELQAQRGEPAEALSEQQILELGTEVGLSAQFLRQALAEERTRPPDVGASSGVLGAIVGPSRVASARTVPGTVPALLARIDEWMQREECLRVKRYFPDRIVWEPSESFLDTIRRGFNVGGRGYALSRAYEVTGTVVPVDAARSLVRLDADLGSHRSSVAGQGATLAAFGAASSGVAVVLGVLVPVAVLPAVAGAIVGYYQAKGRQERALTRAQLALEQVLDRLERGETPRATLLGAIASVASLPRTRR